MFYRLLPLVLLASLLLASNSAADAAVLGSNELDWVLIVDNLSNGSNDHIDIYRPGDDTYVNNAFTIPGTASLAIDAITDSGSPGLAYAITTGGALYRINYNVGTVTQIASLAPPGGDEDTTFDSITNLPGTNNLYILRTGTDSDDIDSFSLQTGTHTTNVFATEGGGAIDISDGPAANIGDVDTAGNPTLYMIATGGNFEVYDITNPSTTTASSHVISSGVSGTQPGTTTYVSLTNAAGLSDQMVVLKDVGSTPDTINLFSTTSNSRTDDVFTVTHTGAKAITDLGPFDPSGVFSMANGGSAAEVTDVGGSPAANSLNGATGLNSDGASLADATNVSASPHGFIYIADDGTANHIDLFNNAAMRSNAPDSVIFKNDNVYSAAATTTAQPSSDFADVSLTDSNLTRSYLWELHTDGKLFRIDPETGDGGAVPFTDIVADYFGGVAPTDINTFDSITNIPNTTKLAILRTDRSLTSKTDASGSNDKDILDLFDYETGVYQQGVYTMSGTGGLSITDGPSYHDVDSAFSTDPAIYLLANGGSFEVYDPTTGLSDVISTGVPVAGDYVDITNLPGNDLGLFAVLDADSGNDRIYFLPLDGSNETLFGTGAGTGGVSITDTNDGYLFYVATGGASSFWDALGNKVDLTSFANQITIGTYASVTNLAEPVPEPSALLLAALGILGMACCLRRSKR